MSKKDTRKSGPIISGFINMIFEVFKHFIKDLENMRKVRKIDTAGEKISNLEHMLVRLEERIDENRKLIENLKNRILWGNIFSIILLLVIIYLLTQPN